MSTIKDTMAMLDHKDFIRKNVGEAVLYEQLSEECVELAHAALKKARKLRGENPTPVDIQDVDAHLIEEITDLMVVLDVLDLKESTEIKQYKLHRWACRNGFPNN